jgi:anthranilate synthase/aminodeoxychorismate synthase-like glutamine amidotransferase
MLVIIDNYDSFTYNLVQYFGELRTAPEADPDIRVYRNDRITLDELVALNPERLVISPGPGTPKESGISIEAIRHFSGKIPVLGVCLGHQCIGAIFGGKVVRAPQPVHGKMSRIRHNGEGLFAGLPNPLEAVRYHSLVVEEQTFPSVLEITATCNTGDEPLVMGLRHRTHPTYGVQFHPESIFTGAGKQILANFLRISAANSHSPKSE